MLKGLALTPPVIGRISIGKVVEKNGIRLPEKDDQFSVTSLIQSKDGWINHPLDLTLRKTPEAKLRSIPIRLLFNDPDLNLRANYSMFDGQLADRYVSVMGKLVDAPPRLACRPCLAQVRKGASWLLVDVANPAGA